MNKIPKIIHYCWISNEEWDPISKKCYQSWKKLMPEYEYKLWDKSTLPKSIFEVPTVKHAMKYKKWAFVSDYVRFWVLYHFGGIYLDLDVEVFKSFNPLLEEDNKFFFGGVYNTGVDDVSFECCVIGSTKKLPLFDAILSEVSKKENFITIPIYLKEILKERYELDKLKFGKIDDGIIHSPDYFFFIPHKTINGKQELYHPNEFTNLNLSNIQSHYCFHWTNSSWFSKGLISNFHQYKYSKYAVLFLKKILGNKIYETLKTILFKIHIKFSLIE